MIVPGGKKKKKIWRSWDLNPGLSACEADTLPLSYTPAASNSNQAAHFKARIRHVLRSVLNTCLDLRINKNWMRSGCTEVNTSVYTQLWHHKRLETAVVTDTGACK